MWLRPKFERYGEILLFELNTKTRMVNAEVKLLDESESLVIEQARYRIEPRGGDTMLVIHDIKLSRTWAQHLIDDYVPEISLKVPDFVRPLID